MYLLHVYGSQRQGYINYESLNATRLQSAITDMVRSEGLSRAYRPHSALHLDGKVVARSPLMEA